MPTDDERKKAVAEAAEEEEWLSEDGEYWHPSKPTGPYLLEPGTPAYVASRKRQAIMERSPSEVLYRQLGLLGKPPYTPEERRMVEAELGNRRQSGDTYGTDDDRGRALTQAHRDYYTARGKALTEDTE